MVKRLLNLAVAALFALPLASLADFEGSSKYSTKSVGSPNYTPGYGNTNTKYQMFVLQTYVAANDTPYMWHEDGDNIVTNSTRVSLDGIRIWWGSNGDENAVIGKKDAETQPDAYLVVTTTDMKILGISSKGDAKWTANGYTTFNFKNTLLDPTVQYRYSFVTNVTGLTVGGTLAASDVVSARTYLLCHYSSTSSHTDASVYAVGDSDFSKKYSHDARIYVSRPWIDEAEASTETTGAWDTTPVWSDGKMAINGDNAFTPTTESPSNSTVTVTMTMCFEDVRDDVIEDPEATEGVQAAVCLATEGAATVFKAFTGTGWVVASAAGVTPSGEETYTMRFTFNYTNRTYGVEVLSGGAYVPLMNGGSAAFQLAQDKYSLSKIKFNGTGTLTSMIGDYEEATAPAEEFAKDDVLTLSDAKTVTLTADQAAWLNSIGEYATVKAWVEGTATEATFGTAYLLNLTTAGALTSFAVTDIAVADTTVTVTVKLERSGAVQSGEKDAPIKGELELHGASSLEAGGTFTKKTATIGDAKFAEGDTTTLVFTKDGTTLFYKPTIVAPAE